MDDYSDDADDGDYYGLDDRVLLVVVKRGIDDTKDGNFCGVYRGDTDSSQFVDS